MINYFLLQTFSVSFRNFFTDLIDIKINSVSNVEMEQKTNLTFHKGGNKQWPTQDDPEDDGISQDWHDKDQGETNCPDQLTQAPLDIRLTETCKNYYLKLVISSEKFENIFLGFSP